MSDAARPAETGPAETGSDHTRTDDDDTRADDVRPDADADDAPDDTTVRVHRVTVDATYVRVSSIGDPGARAFVLVAGLGVSSTYYERLAPNLREFGPVHALDLPGFAGVRKFRGPVTIERYADAVERVIDELGLDDPVLVGHSMGSQVVTEVAARRPDLTSLILISPVVDAAARTVSESAVRFVRSALHEPNVVRANAVSAYVLCGWHWFRRVLPRMLAFPIELRGEAVRAHTLIIRGEKDALVPRDWLRRLARVFPHAVLREITGGAHSVMHAQADAVAALAVSHARGELRDRGVGSMQRVRDTSTTPDLDRLSLRDVGQLVASRVRELVGMARSDDDLLAAGKSEHAAAAADVDGSITSPPAPPEPTA